MNVWDWLFGMGKRVLRDGPAHSSDRHGFWKDLWKLRNVLGLEPEHSGSVDIYDHFGCAPYTDNDIKRERRDMWRPALMVAAVSTDTDLRNHAGRLLAKFDDADTAKGWRED